MRISMGSRSVESLCRLDRELTPLLFARHLVRMVRVAFSTDRVAVLWVSNPSWYAAVKGPLELYCKARNALRYHGPFPVVCHPPCGPWGRLSGRSRESRVHGIHAMNLVHLFGGVVEQPVGSRLFANFGAGGKVTYHEQGDYGHKATKPTLLYWHSGGLD